jgi:hypothetical protein
VSPSICFKSSVECRVLFFSFLFGKGSSGDFRGALQLAGSFLRSTCRDHFVFLVQQFERRKLALAGRVSEYGTLFVLNLGGS